MKYYSLCSIESTHKKPSIIGIVKQENRHEEEGSTIYLNIFFPQEPLFLGSLISHTIHFLLTLALLLKIQFFFKDKGWTNLNIIFTALTIPKIEPKF